MLFSGQERPKAGIGLGGLMAANPVRMARIHPPGRPLLMVPMDHGISMGPVPGLVHPATTLEEVAQGGATCTAVHKGLVPAASHVASRMGILMHLSASTDVGPDSHEKRLVGTVQEAARLGCDGVSIHVNVGARTEPAMLEDAGRVSTQCNALGMPLLAMMYPRGPEVKDPFDPVLVAHAARLGAELGADIVKVPYTGDPDTFRPVVEGAGVPVIIAGGPRRRTSDDFLRDVRGAAEAGAAGVSVGRNVFQSDDPRQAMRDIAACFQ